MLVLAVSLAGAGVAADTCGDTAKVYQCPAEPAEQTGGSYGSDRRRRAKPPPAACPDAAARPWCNPAEAAKDRAQRLADQLDFDELKAQVSCDIFGGVPAIERLGVNQYNFIRENNHGLLWNNVCPIPTMFPQVISMASSFNRTLWTKAGEASAVETRYNYDAGKQNSLFTQTNFNIFVDPRWGRGQEVPGECPELNAAYARAWVQGVQAPKGPGGVPLAGTSCKHFAAYSFEGAGGWPDPRPDSNRHNFNAKITAQDLADTHFPMFEACAQEGAKGMMTSYNAINGVPMVANGALTNNLARDKWGFEGLVCTDCGAVEDLWNRHKFAANATEAAHLALEGGTDVECGNTIMNSAANETEAMLRTAVARSFRVRFELGEFDPPPAAAAVEPEVYDQEAHAQLAYEAAVQGSVLLKNDDGALPLQKGARVALLGPLRSAKWQLLGSYSGHYNSQDWEDAPSVVSIEEGLKDCELVGELILPDGGPEVCSPVETGIPGTHSVLERPDADVVVIVGGLNPEDPQTQDVDQRPYKSGKCQAGCLESEGCDRPGLSLPRGQELLLRRASTWGLPIVLVLISGGPIDLSEVSAPFTSAVFWMGYPGQAAGTALANLLFGRESPSGRLTQTFYRSEYVDKLSIRQMDMRANVASGYPGRSYRFIDPVHAVFPFGHGLSYQTWQFTWASPPEASDPAAAPGGSEGGWNGCSLHVQGEMTSTAAHSYASPSATVLVFLRPPTGTMASAPKRQLRHFAAISASPASLSFELSRRDFELADEEGNWHLQAGHWAAEFGQPPVLVQELIVSENGCVATIVV